MKAVSGVVDVGPLKPVAPDYTPDPDMIICWCRVCQRGPGECGHMQALRAARARRELLTHLTDADRDWLKRHGWDGS